MPRICRERATAGEARQGQARGGARAPPRRELHPGSGASYLLRRGDAVDPATFLLGRSEGEPELLLQGSREEPSDGVPLPAHRTRHFVDGGPLGTAQHRNDLALLWTPVS